MKNRIGYLIASAGVSLGVAAVMLAGGSSAQAAQCNITTAQGVCEYVDTAGCIVAVASTCTGSSCGVAVASDCGSCAVGVASNCSTPPPTTPPPTTPPPAVQKILDSIKTGDN